MRRMKTPLEIARLERKHRNNQAEKWRLMEAEKMIPFKKRRVRFGEDGCYDDTPPTAADRKESVSPPKKRIPSSPRERTPAPLSQSKEATPQPVVENHPVEATPEASSPEHQEEPQFEQECPKQCYVLISKEDQQRCQDAFCQYWWNKLRPGEPFRILKYVKLDKIDMPETSEVETTSTSTFTVPISSKKIAGHRFADQVYQGRGNQKK